MANTVKSSIVGLLVQDERIKDWWVSDAIGIPFLDGKKLSVTFMDYTPAEDAAFLDDADRALSNFFSLGVDYRDSVSEAVHKNCTDYLDMVDWFDGVEDLKAIKTATEIWGFVQPSKIYVTRGRHGDQGIYVSIPCECAWEEEHGLQLVFRQGGKLTRVSGQDGHLTDSDAYGRDSD